MELHVNVDHRDILSPQKNETIDNNTAVAATCSNELEINTNHCPVCGETLSADVMMEHIEDHFSRGEQALTEAEREAQRTREEHEFQLLRAQYGMEEDEDNTGYVDRTTHGLKRAVYSGALSVAGYYERSVGIKKAAAAGRDDGGSKTSGLLEKIAQLNNQTGGILKTYLCSTVDHYASTYGDRGWGCGYRNMQMLLSCLVRAPQYVCLLAEGWDGATDLHIPSIPTLQLLVERAWQLGFDTQGSEQLGCKLYNTTKWIGACEVITVLSSLRIKCSLIDFHKPTGADGGHPALFEWVHKYFDENPDGFKPPLYLQHQGHSRTIIGYEKHKDGKSTLLVLDPSHAPAQVRQVLSGNTATGITAVRLLRRGSSALRARQYQLLAITGVIEDQEQYEASKVLQSIRIP